MIAPECINQDPSQNWKNTIDVKYDHKYRDGAYRVSLKAVPEGAIRFSLDGSHPNNGALYNGEFSVPVGTAFVLAIAEHSGVVSEVVKVVLPTISDPGEKQYKPLDSQKAEWTRKLSRTDRGASYKLLEALKRQAAKIGGANVNIALPGTDKYPDQHQLRPQCRSHCVFGKSKQYRAISLR